MIKSTGQSRGPSPWWGLLLVPLLAAAGWAVGQMSGSEVGPEAEAIQPVVQTAGDRRVKEIRARSASYRARVAAARSSTESPAPAKDVPGSPPRQEMSNWTSIDNALAESRRNGKPVMLDFNADWCGPCHEMKRQVFDDGARGGAVRAAVIPVSIVDRRREDGRNASTVESLQGQYQVDAFPTLVVFNPQSGQFRSTRGFAGADYTVQWIENAARSLR